MKAGLGEPGALRALPYAVVAFRSTGRYVGRSNSKYYDLCWTKALLRSDLLLRDDLKRLCLPELPPEVFDHTRV